MDILERNILRFLHGQDFEPSNITIKADYLIDEIKKVKLKYIGTVEK